VITGENGVGGVAGHCHGFGVVIGCYNTGTITGLTGHGIGGVQGINTDGQTIGCYNTGMVTGTHNVGGVLGISNGATVLASYNKGPVSGKGEIGGSTGFEGGVGGVVGYLSWGNLIACYNTGAVTVTSGTSEDLAGGVIGRILGSTIANNYWRDVSDDSVTWGIGYEASSPTTGSPWHSDTDATPFSSTAWPSANPVDPGYHVQWGPGNNTADGTGDGKYWKSLGSYGGEYPKLWYE
jgi:hypothetical protein